MNRYIFYKKKRSQAYKELLNSAFTISKESQIELYNTFLEDDTVGFTLKEKMEALRISTFESEYPIRFFLNIDKHTEVMYTKCSHEKNIAIVPNKISDGRFQLRKQCLNCGILFDSGISREDFEIKYGGVLIPKIELIEKLDYELKRDFCRILMKKNIDPLNQIANVRKNKYRRYLLSPAWREKRENILKRDSYLCVSCGQKAQQVHHLTYKNIYNEKESELVSICIDCHNKEHEDKADKSFFILQNF